MNNKLTLTQREADEIQLCMWYIEHTNHGTTGHNRMALLARLAHFQGFSLDPASRLRLPDNWSIEG